MAIGSGKAFDGISRARVEMGDQNRRYGRDTQQGGAWIGWVKSGHG